MVKILRTQRRVSWESKTRRLSAATSHKNGGWKQDWQWAPRPSSFSLISLQESPPLSKNLLHFPACPSSPACILLTLAHCSPCLAHAPEPSAPALLRSLRPVALDFQERDARQNSCFGARLHALVSCPAYDLSALVLGVQPKPIREWKEVAGNVLENIGTCMESCVAHLRTVMPQEWEAHHNCAVLPPQVSGKLPRPGGVPTPH